jgi:hypothetical protein
MLLQPLREVFCARPLARQVNSPFSRGVLYALLCTAAPASSTPTAPSPAPSAPTVAAPPSSSTIDSSSPAQSDRIHSTDIAFKPNSAGT